MDIEAVVAAYVECALWAGLDLSRDVGGNNPPLDENYDSDDVAAEALEEIRREVVDFVESCAYDLDGLDPGQIGHDFYLTRNHHGAGFWDRGLGERGDRLTLVAHAYGSSDLCVGGDGKLYVQ